MLLIKDAWIPNSVKALRPIRRFLSRSKGEVGIERLNRRLSELETLKNQSQKLAVIRQEKEAKLEVLKNHASVLKEQGNLPQTGQNEDAMKTYHKVRSYARSLYTALSRGWHCECPTPHHANLRLEARRPGDQDLRFKFLFSYTTGQGQKEVGRL